MTPERLEQWFSCLYQQNSLILKGLAKVSAQTDALTAEMAKLTTSVNALIAQNQSLKATVASHATDDTTVATAVTNATTLAAAVDAAVAAS